VRPHPAGSRGKKRKEEEIAGVRSEAEESKECPVRGRRREAEERATPTLSA